MSDDKTTDIYTELQELQKYIYELMSILCTLEEFVQLLLTLFEEKKNVH